MTAPADFALNTTAWCDSSARTDLPFVDALIGYPERFEGRGRIDQYDVSKRNIIVQPRLCRVCDARQISDELSLDREGFILFESPSEHLHLNDAGTLARPYLKELLPSIQRLTGADHVIPSIRGLIIRNAKDGVVGDRSGAQISVLVHADFTQKTVDQLLPFILGAPKKFRRMVIIQTWRALSAAPQDFPLALCDSSSVSQDEVIIVDSVIGPPDIPGNVFDSAVVYPNPRHRWYYFPEMQPNEVIAWKGFDSAIPESMNVFHTAFDNRAASPNAAPRRSLEARFFAFYE